MNYKRTEWVNDETPLNEDNLNNIERGILDLVDEDININRRIDETNQYLREVDDYAVDDAHVNQRVREHNNSETAHPYLLNLIDDRYTKAESDERLNNAIANLINEAPEDLDTLKEIVDYINEHKSEATDLFTSLSATHKAHEDDMHHHVTQGLQDKWNEHCEDNVIHISGEEHDAYNEHIADRDIHVTTINKANWDSKAEGIHSHSADEVFFNKTGETPVSLPNYLKDMSDKADQALATESQQIKQSIADHIADYTSTVAAINKDIEDTNTNMVASDERLNNIIADVKADLTQAINDNATSHAKLTNDIDGINNKLNDIDTDIANIGTRIDSVIADAEAEHEEINNNINNVINTKLEEVDAKFAALPDTYYNKTETDKNINDAIAALVNSSPEALDTLSELAAALGNDKDFSTTMTTLIGTKADKDHNHDTVYSKLGHDHDDVYSKLTHNHDDIYSKLAHNHDDSYSKLTHNHNDAYSAISHLHDDRYALLNHTHEGIDNISGDIIFLNYSCNNPIYDVNNPAFAEHQISLNENWCYAIMPDDAANVDLQGVQFTNNDDPDEYLSLSKTIKHSYLTTTDENYMNKIVHNETTDTGEDYSWIEYSGINFDKLANKKILIKQSDMQQEGLFICEIIKLAANEKNVEYALKVTNTLFCDYYYDAQEQSENVQLIIWNDDITSSGEVTYEETDIFKTSINASTQEEWNALNNATVLSQNLWIGKLTVLSAPVDNWVQDSSGNWTQEHTNGSFKITWTQKLESKTTDEEEVYIIEIDDASTETKKKIVKNPTRYVLIYNNEYYVYLNTTTASNGKLLYTFASVGIEEQAVDGSAYAKSIHITSIHYYALYEDGSFGGSHMGTVSDIPTSKLQTKRLIKVSLSTDYSSGEKFDGSADVTIGVTGTLSILKGGTGRTSWTANRLVYASSTTGLSQLAHPSTAGSFLRQGTTGAPYWSTPTDVRTAIDAAPTNHSHDYLPLTGGTLTGPLVCKQDNIDFISNSNEFNFGNPGGTLYMGYRNANITEWRFCNGDSAATYASIFAGDIYDNGQRVYSPNNRQPNADYPTGFSSMSSSATWGNQTGSFLTCWEDSTGGSVQWRRDNPNNGQCSLIIDGTIYVNEGNDRVYCSSYKPSPADIGAAPTNHSHVYFVNDKELQLKGNTSDSRNYTSDNPKLMFANVDFSQNIALVFTDHDTQGAPASLTLIGNQGNEVFYVPRLIGENGIWDGTNRVYSAVNKPTASDITGNGQKAITGYLSGDTLYLYTN